MKRYDPDDDPHSIVAVYLMRVESERGDAPPNNEDEGITWYNGARLRGLPTSNPEDRRWHDGSFYSGILACEETIGMIGNGGWVGIYCHALSWLVPITAKHFDFIGEIELSRLAREAMELVADAEAKNSQRSLTDESWWGNDLIAAIGEETWASLDARWYDAFGSGFALQVSSARYILDNHLLTQT